MGGMVIWRSGKISHVCDGRGKLRNHQWLDKRGFRGVGWSDEVVVRQERVRKEVLSPRFALKLLVLCDSLAA